MKVVDLPFFIELGAALEEASSIDPKGEVFDAYFQLFRLRANLDILDSGEHARLSATAHDLAQLRAALIKFENGHFRNEEGGWRSPPDGEKSEYELSSLLSIISRFRTVLIADLRVAAAFAVMRSGIFDVNLLVNSAHEALGDDARKNLDVSVLHEIDACGKCLAFNLPTASGFHAMRAVERAIRAYLGKFFSSDEIRKMNNWGQYIAGLERANSADSKTKPSQEAIALIRQIKDIYRNPVIHPERVLSPEEAATLFHSTLAAISRIGLELGGSQRSLPGLLKRTKHFGAASLLGNQAA